MSVFKLTRLSKTIADRNTASQVKISSSVITKTNPRTAKNSANNRGKDSNLEALRPIWQRKQDLNP